MGTIVPGDLTIGFIGAGKMAQALAMGFINKDLVKAENITASRLRPNLPNPLKEKGVKVIGSNSEVVRCSRVVFIAVKPHQVESLLSEIRPMCSSDKLYISIASGVTVKKLEELLPGGCRVVRVVPNTPSQVGEGAGGVTPGSLVQEGDVPLVLALMTSVGLYEEVPEYMLAGIGAISGSGPAFMFTTIDAMADGGVNVGLPRDLALRFAAQTMLGAAKMVLETGQHPGQLKDAVCSPGGTTIAGIQQLERGGYRAAMIDAVESTYLRTAKLAEPKK